MTLIINDFLPQQQFLELSHLMCVSDLFPWFFNPYVAYEDEEESLNSYFTHTFYNNDEWTSNLSDILKGFVGVIRSSMHETEWQMNSLIRVRGNLYPRTEVLNIHPKHYDYSFDNKAALLYLNDNDGYTEFEDDEKIKSKGNRIVFFNGSVLHNSTNCTTEKNRVTLVANYL